MESSDKIYVQQLPRSHTRKAQVEPRQEMFNGEYSRNNLIYLVRSRALGGGTNDGKTVLNISVRMLVCHQRKSDETQAGG